MTVMPRLLMTAVALSLASAPMLVAQSSPTPPPGGTPVAMPDVYRPEQLTPIQKQARDAVSLLRDSVTAAGGALALLSRDITTTSSQVLESRVSTVVDRCAAAERQRLASEKQLGSADLTQPNELKAKKDMLKSMNALKKPLDQCTSTYAPLAKAGKGQEIRDYGPSRAKPIIAGLQQFNESIKPFATTMNIQFRPILSDAGKSPLD